MKITRTQLPESSILRANTIHDTDSFQGVYTDEHQRIGINEIGKSFFRSGSKWIEKLFAFRNKVVGLRGLKIPDKISDKQKQLDNFKCEKGEQMGLFKVFEKTPNEIILGEDDKHLNFRVSLFTEPFADSTTNKKLIISTTVQFNN
jgi:hypothetical protein